MTERQWVKVRTPNFKNWSGDWETAAIIKELESMPAKDVKPHEALDKAGIKDVFRSFGEVENKRDGRVVIFPSASAGKIERHKGFATNTIIKSLKTLFEDLICILSEIETKKDGHREHGNIVSYEHYLSKFSFDGAEYFVRFTVPIAKNETRNNVHSTAVSKVSIYKKSGIPYFVSAYNNAESEVSISGSSGNSAFVDKKLADFLSSVKPESVSKVVDENGEPLVVYHGTRADFNAFNKDFIGKNKGRVLGDGFYFTSNRAKADRYANGLFGGGSGDIIKEVFLNIRNPYVIDAKNKQKGYIPEGYDGVIDMENGIYVVVEPNQIKSATDNMGAFDGGNPDIRWRIETERKIADILNEFENTPKGNNIVREYAPVSLRTAKKITELTGAYINTTNAVHALVQSFRDHWDKSGHFKGENFKDSLPLLMKTS